MEAGCHVEDAGTPRVGGSGVGGCQPVLGAAAEAARLTDKEKKQTGVKG